MNRETKNFQVVEIFGLPVIKYEGAISDSIVADLYLSQERFDISEQGYAQSVPRFRRNWPTPQEFANESLDDILYTAWPSGLPAEVKNLLLMGKISVFDSHGNNYDELGWGANIHNGGIIPTSRLLDYFESLCYSTALITTCNPKREHLEPKKISVIYPIGLFGREGEFEMVVRRASDLVLATPA